MRFLHDSLSVPSPLANALVITAIIYITLGIYTFRQKARGIAASYLAGVMVSMAWWSAWYGAEIYVSTLSEKLMVTKIEYPAIASVPILWLFFVLEFTGRSSLLTPRNKMLATMIPIASVLGVWTNDFHHMFYAASRLELTGKMILLKADYGWLFWLYSGYSYLVLAVGSLLLVWHIIHTNSLNRTQSLVFLAATLFTWGGNIVYLAQLLPIPGLDITPLAFIPTAAAMTWVLMRFHLLDFIPPAQNAILQNLRDGVLLLDPHRRILYMNHVVEQFIGQSARESLGRLFEDACEKCSALLLPLLGAEEQRTEITLNDTGTPQYFEVLVSPQYFSDRERVSQLSSHILIFRDITQAKEAQAALKYREAILQAVGLAAELFLKSAAWEHNIETVLAHLGEAAGVSRVYIFERHISPTGVTLVSQRYEWARAGIRSEFDNPELQNLDWGASGFERWEKTFIQHGIIAGPVRQLPAAEQEMLLSQDILSIVVMPIFAEDILWGFMGFDDCVHERVWRDTELEALRTAADIFGASLSRSNVEKKLLKRQRALDLMQKIIRTALEKHNLDEMCQHLVDHLGILIRADHCFLNLWNEAKKQAITQAAYGEFRDTYKNLKILPGEKTFTSSALEAGETLIEENVKDTPYCSPRITAQFSSVSMLVVPMIVNEIKVGAVLFGFKESHQFTGDEIAISEQATALVAIALAKFQAMQDAHRRAEESETLRRAWVAISQTLDLKEATTRLLEQLAFVLPHDSASVQLLHEDYLEIVNVEGLPNPSAVIGIRFPLNEDNPNSVVYKTRQPYLLNDASSAHPEFLKPPHNRIRSWLGVPLIVHNEFIGLLAIDSHEPSHFTTDDIELVNAFAGQVAVAVENARLFDEAQRLAITDSLTGLFNRRHFMERAEIEFERARRYKHELSALIFDIDHFKQINDNYGHLIGDQVLRAVANLCIEKLREADPIGRYGGEEFIAMVVETSPQSALKVGERMRKAVENMVVFTDRGDVHITVSIGIAGMNENTPNLETLINRADQALYVAKHKGRNRVVLGK